MVLSYFRISSKLESTDVKVITMVMVSDLVVLWLLGSTLSCFLISGVL